jgi:hypothetical protein
MGFGVLRITKTLTSLSTKSEIGHPTMEPTTYMQLCFVAFTAIFVLPGLIIATRQQMKVTRVSPQRILEMQDRQAYREGLRAGWHIER